MGTKNNSNITSFEVGDVNWKELAEIGILKDELELCGELNTLLSGEKTNPVLLQLILMGVDVELDATLQLVRKNGSVLVEIIGVNPTEE